MHKARRSSAEPHVAVHEPSRRDRSFLEAALEGLSRPQKALPCQFLYDQQGSQLFDRICELPEYYLTRAESAILLAHATDMAHAIGPAATIYELGSGSSTKTPILLDRLDAPAAYVPIDVSRTHLLDASAAIAAAYPHMRVEAVWGDYATPQFLPDIDTPGRAVAFFPGSTIGNLTRRQAVALLKLWRAHLGAGGLMIVGVDLKKDPRVLERAYDDAQGLTASFIANILARANREIDADFDCGAFEYEVRYDADAGAVRMHLVSRADQEVHIAGRAFYFARDERLHVEDSHKYEPQEFAAVAECAGFAVRDCFKDTRDLFSVQVLTAAG
jgi:dimethylhistidine N-methyltransferase